MLSSNKRQINGWSFLRGFQTKIDNYNRITGETQMSRLKQKGNCFVKVASGVEGLCSLTQLIHLKGLKSIALLDLALQSLQSFHIQFQPVDSAYNSRLMTFSRVELLPLALPAFFFSPTPRYLSLYDLFLWVFFLCLIDENADSTFMRHGNKITKKEVLIQLPKYKG